MSEPEPALYPPKDCTGREIKIGDVLLAPMVAGHIPKIAMREVIGFHGEIELYDMASRTYRMYHRVQARFLEFDGSNTLRRKPNTSLLQRTDHCFILTADLWKVVDHD